MTKKEIVDLCPYCPFCGSQKLIVRDIGTVIDYYCCNHCNKTYRIDSIVVIH